MTKDDETSKQIKNALAKLDDESETKSKIEPKKTVRKSISSPMVPSSTIPEAPQAPPPPPAPPLPDFSSKTPSNRAPKVKSQAPRAPEKTQSVIKEESFDYLKNALEARMPFLAGIYICFK